MYKKIYGTKLSRNTNTRKALFRSLIGSLVANGKIETTKAKAKAIQSDVDKLMKFVAKDNVASRRLVLAKLGNDTVSTNLLFILKSKFVETVSFPSLANTNLREATLSFATNFMSLSTSD